MSKEMPSRMPLCHKCANVQCAIYADGEGGIVKEAAGCNQLSHQSWTAGWHDENGKSFLYQHNCPLIRKDA